MRLLNTTTFILKEFFGDGIPEYAILSHTWSDEEVLFKDIEESYTSDWEFFGTKDTLANTISKVTGIGRSVLSSPFSTSECLSVLSVAEKMSWAAKRSTTREEDMAYCLIGLFQINMPLLYGEGHHAFIRLQDEILKNTEDYTLFAWVTPFLTQAEGKSWGYSGLLASSPVYFADNPNAPEFASSRLQNNLDSYSWEPTPDGFLKTTGVGTTESSLPEPPIRTARGIRLSLPMIQAPDSNDLLAYIHCGAKDKSGDILCLVLRLSSHEESIYQRSIYQRSIFKDGLRWLNCSDIKTSFTYKTVYVEEVALDTRPPLVRDEVISWETPCDIVILIFGKPGTNVGLTAQVQFRRRLSYAFEIVHPHTSFLVGLSTHAKCKISLEMLGDKRDKHWWRWSSKRISAWIRSFRSADTVSLGESSWINVLAKEAPKTWIHMHGDESARKGWKVETWDRVILLYVWADCLLKYVGTYNI